MQLPFDDCLNAIVRSDETLFRFVPERSWMQGRALFGGMAAAVALKSAKASVPNLPPLRTAQFSFIRPIAGPAEISVEMQKTGKTATFVSVETQCDDQLAMRADFVFSEPRQTRLAERIPIYSGSLDVNHSNELFLSGKRPRLAQNFDIKLIDGARPVTGAARSDYSIMASMLTPSQYLEEAALALSDLAPPAVLQMFPEPAPISTVNWSFQSLLSEPVSEIDKVFIVISADSIVKGASFQTSTLWTEKGVAIARNVQTIASYV